jgi:hypothetical protein
MSHLIFTNPANSTSFYDIQNDFIGSSFWLKGPYNIPLRGKGRIATFNQITFDTGFVVDPNQLERLVQNSNGNSTVIVNTSSKINIPQIEMIRAYGFTGSSDILDFSGTTLILSNNNINITSPQELRYFSKKGTGNIVGKDN